MINQHCRRDFLRFSALAAATIAVPSLAESSRRKIPIALELYSVRKELAVDFTGTIEAVGKMGYEGVEFAGYFEWQKKPKELRKLLDDNGLKCCGTHTAQISLEGDNLKNTAELHDILGNKYLICPSLSAKTGQGWADLGKRFSDIAGRAKELGKLVGYHSHASDFKQFDGKSAWEIFFDNTSPDVIHQLDTGNTLDGGGDPLALIKKYAGRTKTTHIKEHGGTHGAPVGEGTIDWKAYLETYETIGGVEWYIIEHETGKVPLESVKASLENFRKLAR